MIWGYPFFWKHPYTTWKGSMAIATPISLDLSWLLTLLFATFWELRHLFSPQKDDHHGYITFISHHWPRHAPNQLALGTGKSMSIIRTPNSIHLTKFTFISPNSHTPSWKILQECFFPFETCHECSIFYTQCVGNLIALFTTTKSLLP